MTFTLSKQRQAEIQRFENLRAQPNSRQDVMLEDAEAICCNTQNDRVESAMGAIEDFEKRKAQQDQRKLFSAQPGRIYAQQPMKAQGPQYAAAM